MSNYGCDSGTRIRDLAFAYTVSVFNHPPRLTQSPTLSGMENEYQPRNCKALGLGSKGRYGSFHLWINVWVQWRKSGWNSGGTQGEYRRLGGGEGWNMGRVYPYPTGEPPPLSPETKNYSLEMACFGAFWAALFVHALARKWMLNFPPHIVIWWTLRMYVWEIAN